MMFESTLLRSPATVRAADHRASSSSRSRREDLPAADALSRSARRNGGRSVMPAIELADDRQRTAASSSASLRAHRRQHLERGRSRLSRLGLKVTRRGAARHRQRRLVGEGNGGDAMGHPFNSVA
jgi:hypothetical protein